MIYVIYNVILYKIYICMVNASVITIKPIEPDFKMMCLYNIIQVLPQSKQFFPSIFVEEQICTYIYGIREKSS